MFRNNKKSGFTLIETIMVLSLFSLVVIGVIGAINRSYSFLSRTKLQVIATNLAREGVEQMFIMRDSNRRRWSGLKDEHRIDINMGGSATTFKPGLYILKENISNTGTYISAEQKMDARTLTETQNVENCYSEDGFFSDYICEELKEKSKIVFTGTYNYLSGDDESLELLTGNIADLLGGETDFYRVIRVYGIYDKNSTFTDASITNDDDLKNGTPAELRFCSKVFYGNSSEPHAIELCSMMTNFEK